MDSRSKNIFHATVGPERVYTPPQTKFQCAPLVVCVFIKKVIFVRNKDFDEVLDPKGQLYFYSVVLDCFLCYYYLSDNTLRTSIFAQFLLAFVCSEIVSFAN